jgi:hypothetical protein
MTIPAITIFLLIGVLTALTWFIWKRKPEEAEPEIDIGDGSFESLRPRNGRDAASQSNT